MYRNLAYSEYDAENNGPRKWWHHRWAKIIGISLIILIIVAVTLSLVLKFVILAPTKPETTATIVTLPSLTTTTTTIQQSSKLQRDST